MEIIINKKLGNDTYTFTFDKADSLDSLATAGFFASTPTKCTCGSSNVQLGSHKSVSEKGAFTFVYIECKDCGAKAHVGQYKSGGFYWKRFESYMQKEFQTIQQ